MKEMVKLYKKHLEAALSRANLPSPMPRPFLYMQVTCPTGTYDVNIEPAKDEVLFLKPEKLLSLAEELFLKAYQTGSRREEQVQRSKRPRLLEHSFDLLLARKPTMTSSTNSSGVEDAVLHAKGDGVVPSVSEHHHRDISLERSAPLEETGSTLDNEETPDGHVAGSGDICRHMCSMSPEPRRQQQRESQDEEPLSIDHRDEDLRNAAILNPWTIAAMTTKVVPRGRTLFDQDDGPTTDCRRTSLRRDAQLPTRSVSPPSLIPYQNPGPPVRRRTFANENIPDRNTCQRRERERCLTYPTRQSQSYSLRSWIEPLSLAGCTASSPPPSDMYPKTRRLDENRFEDDGELQVSLDGIQNQPSVVSQGGMPHPNRNDKSPLERLVTGHGNGAYEQSAKPITNGPAPGNRVTAREPTAGPPTRVSPSNWPGAVPDVSSYAVSNPQAFRTTQWSAAELAEIMDFERRKKAALAHHRKQAVQAPLWRQEQLQMRIETLPQGSRGRSLASQVSGPTNPTLLQSFLSGQLGIYSTIDVWMLSAICPIHAAQQAVVLTQAMMVKLTIRCSWRTYLLCPRTTQGHIS